MIKFCGDAVLIMWSCPLISSALIKRSVAIQATQCGLDLLQTYGNYESSSGTEHKVSLRLHCGMSVGNLHCMSLGTSDRMEFLVSGKVLQEMGIAESNSKLGEICLSKVAYDLVDNDFDGKLVTPNVVRIVGPRLSRSSLRHSTAKSVSRSSIPQLPRHKKRHRVYVDSVYGEEGDEPDDLSSQISKGVGSLFQGQIENRDFKTSLIRYVHESARKFILESSDFLAEIRMVATLFIQILNLDEDFDEGRPQRPQQVLFEILDIMKRLGGALRQYVVDDKGCVVICNFGVAGFSTKNDPLRAVSAAMSIRDHLSQCDINCRIGVTQGMAYCGYVGSKSRKEYAVMGSSVNLASRLMGKANENQILVDTNIYLGSQKDVEYQTLPKIEAKGYSNPVQVYSPVSYQSNSTMEEVVNRPQVSKLAQLVGRTYEITVLSNAVTRVLGQSSPSKDAHIAIPSGSMKNKQMSLRATLSQIIEESSTKNAQLDFGLSPSSSHDERATPRVHTSLVSPRHPNMTESSPEYDNIYIVVGGPGYGKTTLINEVTMRNASVMCPPIRVNCHVSSMYEPYEVIGNLFEELMAHASLPDGSGSGLPIRRNSSPKRRKRTQNDLFHSISEDEEGESTSFRSGLSNSDDPRQIEKHINENLYQTLSSWIEYNMPETLFEYISSDSIWKGSASTQKMDSKDDENGIPAPHLVPERMASCLRSKSSRRFSAGSVGGVGITITNKTKVFQAMEVVPLLRICLNTEELPPAHLLSEFTSNGLEDMISSICSEVICELLSTTSSRCLIIEDLHWCDKRSFEALMLTLSIFEKDAFFLGSMRLAESSRNSRKYAHILSSEGSNFVNSTDDLHIDCQILELQPFTKTDVKLLLRNTLGTSLINETPNILSDENVSRILSRSNSVPSEVAEQVKALEMNITRSKYGIIDRLSSCQDDHLMIYDELSKESQMIVKIASVCGMSFSLALLLHALKNMGYTSLVANIERSLTELEEKNVFKRVSHNPEVQNDSTRALVSVKSRLFRAETTTVTWRQSSKSPHMDPKKRYFTFLDKSFREMIYSLMLSTQRVMAHAVIGDYLSNEYQEMQSHDCQDAEALAYHFSKANDLHKEVFYTVESAKLFQDQYKTSTAYQHFHQLVVLSTKFESIEDILQHCCTKSTYSSYYDVFVRTIFKRKNFGQFFISSRYLNRDDFLHTVESILDFIPMSHLSNFIAEMSILKFK